MLLMLLLLLMLLAMGVVTRAEEGTRHADGSPGPGDEAADRRLEAFFRSTLELVRPEMRRGNKSLAIGVMDPLPLPDYAFERPGEFLHVRARFSRIRLPQLASFRLDNVTADAAAPAVTVRCSYPSLTGVGDYLFETSTFGVPVVSTTGRFRMHVTNINATGHIRLERRREHDDDNGRQRLRCADVAIDSTEDEVTIDMLDLAGDDLLRRWLNPRDVYLDYKPRIHAKIADAFRKALDFAFTTFDP